MSVSPFRVLMTTSSRRYTVPAVAFAALFAAALVTARPSGGQATSPPAGPKGKPTPAIHSVNGEELVFDGAGNLYTADCVSALVVRISPQRHLSVVAGDGFEGFSGNRGLGPKAELGCPWVSLSTAGETSTSPTT